MSENVNGRRASTDKVLKKKEERKRAVAAREY